MLLLRHAAAHADEHIRAAAFERLEGADVAENPILGMLPDGAGVEQDEIRVVGLLGEAEAHIRQHALDVFGIGDILLAAEGAHAGQGRTVGQAAFVMLPHPVHIAALNGQFFRCDLSGIGHKQAISSLDVRRNATVRAGPISLYYIKISGPFQWIIPNSGRAGRERWIKPTFFRIK